MSRLLKLTAIAAVIAIPLIAIVESNSRNTAAVHAASKQPHNAARRIAAKSLESNLLSVGFDVQVSWIEEDDSQLMIYGKSVNRPFAHNLMAQPDFRKLLRDGQFSEVTFLDSMTSPSFSQAYELRTASALSR